MPTQQADQVTDSLRESLRNVFWIGGGPGGGKSTMARRLAHEYGLQLYATDDVMPDHASRITDDEAPYLAAFKAMDMDERWLNRSPQVMLETFHWFRGEGFSLIIDDLLRLPAGPGVVVDGFRLLPHLVKPLLTNVDHAVWLLPSTEFREMALATRGSTWKIPKKTSDPDRALQNLSDRDDMFTNSMIAETERVGVRAILLEVGMSEDELFAQVAEQFGLKPPIS